MICNFSLAKVVDSERLDSERFDTSCISCEYRLKVIEPCYILCVLSLLCYFSSCIVTSSVKGFVSVFLMLSLTVEWYQS